ncbi:unnamed protein product [Adineta ricciae]|uniref:SCP domain-containing protein n=1 Tax=Adineta ricciae TaxID=249248 RepID=A0A815DPY2_ADIRI|nr:unnamed protein product [Adineta ricciae]CAF1482909.1 unnamed protein product [Adineta ricciae]
MQHLSILLSYLLMNTCLTMGAINLDHFRQEALAQHNYYRQQIHCTQPMSLDASLNTMAQNYAEYLAYYETFQHSGEDGVGENLYMESYSAGITYVNGSKPTADWYSEIEDYDYSNPGSSSGTGHFTQVVWTDSVQMGIGIALSSDGQSAYVVANYYPPGNFQGEYGEQVPPVCPSTTTTTARTTTTTTTTTTITTTTTTTGSIASTTTAAPTTTATTGSTASTTTVAATTTKITTGSTTTNDGTPMSTTTLDNSAIGWCYRYYHFLATLLILGRQFRFMFRLN